MSHLSRIEYDTPTSTQTACRVSNNEKAVYIDELVYMSEARTGAMRQAYEFHVTPRDYACR